MKHDDPRESGPCIVYGPDSPLVKAMNEALANGEAFTPGVVQKPVPVSPHKFRSLPYSRHERAHTFSDVSSARTTIQQEPKNVEPAIPTYADAINKAIREARA